MFFHPHTIYWFGYSAGLGNGTTPALHTNVLVLVVRGEAFEGHLLCLKISPLTVPEIILPLLWVKTFKNTYKNARVGRGGTLELWFHMNTDNFYREVGEDSSTYTTVPRVAKSAKGYSVAGLPAYGGCPNCREVKGQQGWTITYVYSYPISWVRWDCEINTHPLNPQRRFVRLFPTYNNSDG